MAGHTKLARVVTAELVTTWQYLSGQGRSLLAWWLFAPATAIVVGVVSLPEQPATAIGLLTAAVALICRFTRPVTSLLVGTGITTVALIWPSTTLSASLWPVSVLLAYAVGRQVPDTRRAVAALALATGWQTAAGLADRILSGATPDPSDTGLNVVITVLTVVLPGAIGMLQGERARAMDALYERNTLLEHANLLGESQARMQERARIAGEMHDLLGHRLSLIVLYAGALEMRTRTVAPEINEQADLLRTTSRTALDELRGVLGILRLDGAERPDGTDATVGTREDVTGLAAEARHAHLPLTLTWHGDDLTDADAGTRRAVNRIVREALTNVHKHAPGAPTRLTVTVDAETVTVQVRNAARPPAVPPPSSGLGLAGLRERVRLAGGDFTAGTDPVTGDHIVTAELPLHPRSPSAIGPADGRPVPADRQMPPPGAREIPRARQPRRTRTALSCLAAVAVVVCGGLGFSVYYRIDSAISPGIYRQIRTGDTQDRVRELTGGDSAAAREEGLAERPATPAGTTCEYAMVEGLESVFRFCFKDGKLTQKDKIPRQ
ncbi:sensor histidine kinase [Streptomyces scabiei]|uniref:sensor histidine kinase n=1 Tax=Streptomyces scabiei TaxID=1930 RepID=UPI000A66499E|nr:histidine kinase [Streptomyces scabiei]MDX2830302.1 histidine kinase [Streptomyces scabiei]MDX3676427.1 histidine kinase [Streptomyces scabiei]